MRQPTRGAAPAKEGEPGRGAPSREAGQTRGAVCPGQGGAAGAHGAGLALGWGSRCLGLRAPRDSADRPWHREGLPPRAPRTRAPPEPRPLSDPGAPGTPNPAPRVSQPADGRGRMGTRFGHLPRRPLAVRAQPTALLQLGDPEAAPQQVSPALQLPEYGPGGGGSDREMGRLGPGTDGGAVRQTDGGGPVETPDGLTSVGCCCGETQAARKGSLATSGRDTWTPQAQEEGPHLSYLKMDQRPEGRWTPPRRPRAPSLAKGSEPPSCSAEAKRTKGLPLQEPGAAASRGAEGHAWRAVCGLSSRDR
ncbi:Sushi, nidogen and EGF-like domain-containing protein 1 [Galemys pyrenaicus]|uniref:Sushi, nidogen and EGF-like domain-containing protein 1 n=1 Tax=Galemys pyrenaicus TaxID=202257 RepID=A0A8J6DHC7_GALPY|nr:Sushi, nidogen and EGF-like domain-containing protein 1 [Galemys pyrenaicus]